MSEEAVEKKMCCRKKLGGIRKREQGSPTTFSSVDMHHLLQFYLPLSWEKPSRIWPYIEAKVSYPCFPWALHCTNLGKLFVYFLKGKLVRGGACMLKHSPPTYAASMLTIDADSEGKQAKEKRCSRMKRLLLHFKKSWVAEQRRKALHALVLIGGWDWEGLVRTSFRLWGLKWQTGSSGDR